MRKRRCIIIDDEIYKDFQLYAIKKGKTISKLVEKYMSEVTNEPNKKIKKN